VGVVLALVTIVVLGNIALSSLVAIVPVRLATITLSLGVRITVRLSIILGVGVTFGVTSILGLISLGISLAAGRSLVTLGVFTCLLLVLSRRRLSLSRLPLRRL